jgi:pimeloyl-ACP methyl ester carboxylesterase
MGETSVTVRIADVSTGPADEAAGAAGTRLSVSSAGQPGDPVVVLLHGFPEMGYAWRHQIRSFAAAGYRVLAPDQRGHGWSAAPEGIEEYRMDRLVDDVIGLLDADGADDAVIMGHDWGAWVATATALTHPDRVRGVAMLSTPYVMRSDVSLLNQVSAGGSDAGIVELVRAHDDDYEASLQADPIDAIRRIQWASCGGLATAEPDDAVPSGRPPHLNKGEFENYFRAYAKSGFANPLNVLRNHQANWELAEPWTGATLDVPAVFLIGDRDPVVQMADSVIARHVDALTTTCTEFRGQHLIEGAGHWLQQEAPEPVSALLLAFLEDVA